MKSSCCYCKITQFVMYGFYLGVWIIILLTTEITLERDINMDRADTKTAMEELSIILIYLVHFTERDRFAN